MKVRNILHHSLQTWAILGMNLLVISSILRCTGNENRKFRYADEFYNSIEEPGYRRLPLIKPYKLISTGNTPLIWGYNLKDTSAYVFSQTPAQEVAITKDFILLKYTGEYGFNYDLKTELYTLIDRKNGQEYILESNRELQKKMDSLDMKSKPMFELIDSIFFKYLETNKLPWLQDSADRGRR